MPPKRSRIDEVSRCERIVWSASAVLQPVAVTRGKRLRRCEVISEGRRRLPGGELRRNAQRSQGGLFVHLRDSGYKLGDGPIAACTHLVVRLDAAPFAWLLGDDIPSLVESRPSHVGESSKISDPTHGCLLLWVSRLCQALARLTFFSHPQYTFASLYVTCSEMWLRSEVITMRDSQILRHRATRAPGTMQ